MTALPTGNGTFGAIAGGLGVVGGLLQSASGVRPRLPQAPDIKEVTKRANEALFASLGTFGQQLEASRAQSPEFEQRRQELISGTQSLADRLRDRGATGLLTEQIRASQAARGVALSPAAALEEGLRITQARTGLEGQALGLQERLLGLSTAAPVAPQIADLGQLIGAQSQFASQGFNAGVQRGFQGVQQQDAQQAALGSLFSRLGGGFAQGFGGQEDFATGFGRGVGALPTRSPLEDFISRISDRIGRSDVETVSGEDPFGGVQQGL